ncbi:hypothetical protein Pmani_012468 [Petrolisthes manimaculis]|uniref:Uncharacterized protein n=1 Tax=Petrolisthes manimaculis TaxID=1843537 RepID=A0AAE1UA78_9EUCA|nr:hypothetical protein Pmani_012468 [Petrolisthes manimaculis]
MRACTVVMLLVVVLVAVMADPHRRIFGGVGGGGFSGFLGLGGSSGGILGGLISALQENGTVLSLFGQMAGCRFGLLCDSQECRECILNIPGADITQDPAYLECFTNSLGCTTDCLTQLRDCVSSITAVSECLDA